jgi:hypothetical protein
VLVDAAVAIEHAPEQSVLTLLQKSPLRYDDFVKNFRV